MPISRGTKASGGTDFVTGYTISADEVNTDLNTAYSGVNNLTITDSNVSAGAAIDGSKINDYSASAAEMRTTANPLASSTWTETSESLATNLEEELARIRDVLKQLTGGTYWYSRRNYGVLTAPVGAVWPYMGTSAPTGWILWTDGTIGNAASGASARANADTVDLYSLLWTAFSNSICPVSTGRGASAAADYAANKTLRLPLGTGRVPGIAGTPASANTTSNYITGTATAGGAATITLQNNNTAPTKNDVINNYTIETTGGTGSGQTRTISGYAASTRIVTVSVAWGTAPDATTTYAIYKTLSTRSAGDRTGLEEWVPNIDTLASHTHTDTTGGDGSGGNADSGDGTSVDTLTTNATGTGSAFTTMQPTFFMNWIIKL